MNTVMILSWALLYICLSGPLGQAESQLQTEREASSGVCLAQGYCTAQAAVEALKSELSLSQEEAEEITRYTHNDTILVWRSCGCSHDCDLTNNCCPDAQRNTAAVPVSVLEETVRIGCSNTRINNRIVPVVESCPEDPSILEEIKTLCHEGKPDGGKLVKFSSSKSYVTYSNIYCAMCHGEEMPDLFPWSITLACNTPIVEPNVTDTSIANTTLFQLSSSSLCVYDETSEEPPADLADDIGDTYGVLLTSGLDEDTYCDMFNQIISICPEGAETDIDEACRNKPASYVINDDGTKIYRNIECAKCHAIDPIEDLKCQKCTSRSCKSGTGTDQGQSTSFAVLIQPYTSKQASCKAFNYIGEEERCSGDLAKIPSCNAGEYLDTTTLTCIPICPEGFVLYKGICQEPRPMISSNCDEMVTYGSYKAIAAENQIDTSVFSNNGFMMELNNGSLICHSCTRTVKTFKTEGLTIHNNGSMNIDNVIVDQPMIAREENSTYLCLPATKSGPKHNKIRKATNQDILEVQGWLTIVLCIVSIICIILFFIAFFSVKRMRNIPGSTIAGNMLMFFFAYITFLIKDLVKVDGYVPNEMACKVIAILINYFFLSGFVFMIIYAVLIIRSLEFVDLDTRYTSMYVLQLWIAGILTPFVFILPAILMDNFKKESVWSPGYGHKHSCFMENREGNVIFFVAPIGLCLVISFVIYVVVVHRLRQIAAATSRVRQSHKEKVFLCLKLIVVLGFNWLSAILASAVDQHKYPTANAVLTTIFIILCCLHGFFGFIVFVVSGSNLKLIKDKINYSKVSSEGSSSGGRATRTLSGPGGKGTSTAASEMSTMLRGFDNKASPKYSPILGEKFAHEPLKKHDSVDKPVLDSLSPTGGPPTNGVANGVNNESPLSTRSNNSQRKCDFF